MKIKKRYLGLSIDGLTNRWELICECGTKWKPTTTMIRCRLEECPKCGVEEIVDYNED